VNNFKKWLTESVTFEPEGYEASDVKDIADLGYKVRAWLHQHAPLSQKATNPEGIFTIDGLNTHLKKGTMNLYPTGVPETEWAKIVNGAVYAIGEMGVKHGKFRKEQSGTFHPDVVYRIDVEIPDSQNRAPEVNMSNDMADLVLQLMGMRGVQSLQSRELLWKIQSINDFQIDKAVEPAKVDKKPGKADVHFGGVDKERIQRNIKALHDLAQWAVDNDYDTIAMS
jgi:hypothetical protein